MIQRLTLTFLLCFFIGFWYNNVYPQTAPYKLKYAKEDYQEIINSREKDTISLYIIDSQDIDTLLKYSSKPYRMVFFYAFWCSASVKNLPTMLSYAGDSLDIFLVATEKYKHAGRISYYLKKYCYYSFILDVKTAKRDTKRMQLFIEKLCPSCKANNMGYSDFFVYDNKNHIVLHTNYHQSFDFMIDELEKLIFKE